MQKMNVIDKSCHYSEIAQRVYKCSDAQHTSLTAEEEQNSLTYGTLVCLNIYGSYTLKNSPVFLSHSVQY